MSNMYAGIYVMRDSYQEAFPKWQNLLIKFQWRPYEIECDSKTILYLK